MEKDFKDRKFVYVRQSCYAAIYMGVMVLVMEGIDGVALFPCLAATAFIVFVFPNANISKPRVLIGGYIIASLVGSVFGMIGRFLVLSDVVPGRPDILLSILTVFLVVLAMTAFDFEHPPAAAMAATLALLNTPIPTAVIAVLSVFVLCILKWILRNHLQDL